MSKYFDELGQASVAKTRAGKRKASKRINDNSIEEPALVNRRFPRPTFLLEQHRGYWAEVGSLTPLNTINPTLENMINMAVNDMLVFAPGNRITAACNNEELFSIEVYKPFRPRRVRT